MRFLVSAVCILFVGCTFNDSSPCAFDLESEGWSRVEKGSNRKIQPISDSSNWYLNANGDYLICYEVTSDGKCSGVYERFTKRESGEFINEEIVCME